MKALTALVLLITAMPAGAELLYQSSDAISIRHRYEIAAAPAAAWRTLLHPERWWPESHTWSGARTHLSLTAEAGGCFCEQWDGGSAEHGRVVMAQPGRTLRLVAALGPLQSMAVSAVLTISLSVADAGTLAEVTYRVSGDPGHRLDGIAAVVDSVIGQQFGAFAVHAATVAD